MVTETVSYSDARERLASLMESVEANRGAIVISRRGHANVVLVAEDEFLSLLETAHLLQSPANARRLLEALMRSRAGRSKETTIDEFAERIGLATTER